MRITLALTFVLGVSASIFTATTASSIGVEVANLAPNMKPLEPRQLSQPFGDVVIKGDDLDFVIPEADDAAAPSIALRVEEPEEEKPSGASKDEEDDGPVTVPITQVCEAMADAAAAQGLPIGFFARLIWQESKFDQFARSHAGAMGVAQFMPPTAEEFGLENPFDPIESVAASARFLRQLRDQFGNLGLAAAAYNAGGGRIRKWLNGQSEMPKETLNYVKVITGHPPKRWTVQKPLEVSFALPRKAPCEGVVGLSREANAAQHPVRLTDMAEELIEEAEEARRAKIAAAREARNKKYATARAAKARKVAKDSSSKKAKVAAGKSKKAKAAAAKTKDSKRRVAEESKSQTRKAGS